MARHQGWFEAGRILQPKDAAWPAEFESALLAFPNDRRDDQVDALLLFLDWLAENEHYIVPITAVTAIVHVAKPSWLKASDPQIMVYERLCCAATRPSRQISPTISGDRAMV